MKAELLVLADSVILADARNMLWRRKVRNERSGGVHSNTNSLNAVVIRDIPDFCEVSHVLYTDFSPAGKIANPNPRTLAEAAIHSVAKAEPGRDGISYLINLVCLGVVTALTQRYTEEILTQTETTSLEQCFDLLRSKNILRS